MRDVADVAREKRVPACGVDGFEHDLRSRPKLVIRGLEKAHQIIRLEVLDDLRRKQTAERSIGLRTADS